MIRCAPAVTLDAILIRNFAIALLLGALVGVEREKKKAGEGEGGIGGLRTFILFAEAGAVAAWLAVTTATPMLFAGIGLIVTAVVIAGYYFHAKQNPTSYGLTTEIAALVVFLLGGLVLYGQPELAVALGIATSALLAFKQPLHGAVEKLGQEDLYAGLKLLIATFIVLPLLPDHPIDPWGALNPYKLWWLVILISTLSLVGYVAVRWLGHERGTSLTGFFGGLVSSTAVTLSFSRRSREEKGIEDVLATGILLAWAVMFVRVIVEVAVVERSLVPPLALPMGACGLLALAVALLHYRASAGVKKPEGRQVPLKNPFSLTSAAKFGAFFAAVLLVVKLVQDYASGTRGLYAIAALAGLTDVDAITLSMAQFARSGGEAGVAVGSITVAALTNTAVKCGLVLALAARPLKLRMIVATALVLAGGGAGLLLSWR